MNGSSVLDLKPKLDYPAAFKTLRDFHEAFMDSVARHDQAFTNYLAEYFTVGNDGVAFIGNSDLLHSGDNTTK